MTKPLQFALRFAGAAAITVAVLAAAGPYVSEGVLAIPSSVQMGAVSAVDIDADGRVYVLHRGEPPVLAFGRDGRYTHGFGNGMFKVAHGLRIDRAGYVWTTDNGRHVLRKFSRDGKLLATYGVEDAPGDGPDNFRSPDDLVFASDGSIYVADAGNGRIVRLKADGSYVSEWGRKGKADGEFAAAHGIAIDSADRIYVADRGNNRVQVFSPAGKFVAAWTDFGNPFGVLVVGDVLLVSDGDVHRISHLRLTDGKITAQWGDPQTLQLPHLMAVSPEGKLYVAEVNGNRVQIFRKTAGAPSGAAAR